MGALERIVRRFGQITSKPKTRTRTPPSLELPEAHIRWGKPSDFALEDIRARGNQYGLGDSGDDEDEPERERVTMSEEGRTFTDYRIENPDDAEQYIVLRSVNTLAMSYPQISLWAGPLGMRTEYTVSGAQFLWRLNGDAGLPPEEEGEGQEPPSPPDLDDME